MVVGGGIAGLTAAYHLTHAEETRTAPRVTVLEGAARFGGKLAVSPVAGVEVDEGAEAMLARRPEGLELARAVGLGDALVTPGTTSASILSHGALRRIPAGQVQGVPGDLAALARSDVLSAAGLARAPMDLILPVTPLYDDISVAAYVGARLGGEVVDRLVEPLLGGVYAGRAEHLSLAATLPKVFEAARDQRSLILAARSLSAAARGAGGPVFATIDGGMGRLPGAVADAVTARSGQVRTSAMVRGLERTAGGWRLTVGPTRAPEYLDADAVVLAVPARPASRLLDGVAPVAAAELGRVEYAGMALITLAYPRSAFPHPPGGSGYLVPAVEEARPGSGERRAVKAVTFVTTKWPHIGARDEDLVIVRCSIGRHGDQRLLQRSDAELVELATREMADVGEVREPPRDTRVSRWGGGLPQYGVGHLDLVARTRADVAAQPGLAVCGAVYDGVGVPACAASARAAATLVHEHLGAA